MSIYKKELFVCDCDDVRHQIIFLYEEGTYDELNDSINEVYCEIYLNTWMTFWQRLIYGIKYIFGYKSKYGAFDVITLDPDDHERFQNIATQLTAVYNEKERLKAKKALAKNEVRGEEK